MDRRSRLLALYGEADWKPTVFGYGAVGRYLREDQGRRLT